MKSKSIALRSIHRLGLSIAAAVALVTPASAQSLGPVHLTSKYSFWESIASTAKVVDVGLSANTTVGVRADGTLYGASNRYESSVGLASEGKVKQVAVNSYSTLVLHRDGTLTGHSMYDGYGIVAGAASLTNVTQVAVGDYHAAALLASGRVVAWGEDGPHTVVPPEAESGVKRISIGWAHTVALKEDGSVVVWSYNEPEFYAPPAGLQAIDAVASDNGVVAVKTDGTLAVWGSEYLGEIGHLPEIPAGRSAVSVAAGYDVGVVLLDNGTVMTWGSGSDSYMAPPVGLSNVKQVFAEGETCAALTNDGRMVVWGNQSSIPDVTDTVQIQGYYTSFRSNVFLFLKNDGTISAWGQDDNGLATGAALVANAKKLAGSFDVAGILKNDGSVVVVGGSADAVAEGVRDVPPGLVASDLAMGLDFGLAINASGKVVTWGHLYGDFPDELTPGSASPVIAQQVTAGYRNSAALLADGSVMAWGTNGGTTVPSELRHDNPDHEIAVAIFAQGERTTAVLADGSIYAWYDGGNLFTEGALSGALAAAFGNFSRGKIDASGVFSSEIYFGFGSVYPPVGDAPRLTSISYCRSQVSDEQYSGLAKFQVTVGAHPTNPALAKGRIFLPRIDPDHATQIFLQTESPAVSVPASVTIPAGQRQVTFDVTYTGQTGDPVLSARYEDMVKLAIAPAPTYVPTTFTLSAASYVGGSSASLTGTFTATRDDSNDRSITLTSSHSSVTFPTTVTLPAGQQTVTFPVTASLVPATTAVTVTATMGSTAVSAKLSNTPLQVSALSFTPNVTVSGTTVRALVRLNALPRANATVAIAAVRRGAAQLPASVIVPAGTNSLQFDVPTDELGPDDDAKTTSAAARFNGSGASASLTVNPASVIYVSLPSEVYTHKIAWGKVTIGAPAGPSGVTVRIQSVSENIETPQDAFVPAGQRTAFFPVLGGEVSSPSFGEIVAYTGFTYLYQSTVVVPNPVKIATVSPSTVYGGAGPLPKLTVTLLNAVDKPTLVRLDSSDPGIQVPATLTIPAGSATGSVNVIHSRLPVQTAVTIGAEFCGVRKTTVLTVFTNPLNSLGLSHGQVAGGSATVVTGTIKLRFAVTRDTVVNLSSSLPCASVPATVTIPAGSIGATFVISHFPVASVQLPVITASIGDEALTKTLSVKKS